MEEAEVEGCPICNRKVPVIALERHVNGHLDEEQIAWDQELAQQMASTSQTPCKDQIDDGQPENVTSNRHSNSAVKCSLGCGQNIPVEEWESHLLQHELALQETGGQQNMNNSKRAGSGLHGEGRSHTPENRSLKDQSLDDTTRAVLISQMREPCVRSQLGLMTLLQQCLESEQRGFSTVALSGYVEHFDSKHKEDLGWGCGWRNIQMLCSHLLVEDQEAKEVLFGGAGFVPDIPALQRWLEIAWAKGFDVPGAEYFEWRISGTHKWIGTTECAALLRSFGIRARIIDFQANKRGRNEARGKCGSNSEPTRNEFSPKKPLALEIPQDAECVGCGKPLIQGTQCSDLCPTCIDEVLQQSPKKDERRTLDHSEGMPRLAGKSSPEDKGNLHEKVGNDGDKGQKEATINHQHLIDWVWNYFLDRADKESVTNAGGPMKQPVIVTKSSPLYFQHKGHSRTIVGIERRWKHELGADDDVFLLVLDPSQRTEDIGRCLRERTGWQRLVKRGVHTLKQAEYQLCYVDRGVAVGEELEGLKVLSSVHYTY